MACITLGSFEENGLYFQFVTQRECCIEIHYFFFPCCSPLKQANFVGKKEKKKGKRKGSVIEKALSETKVT